MEMLSQFKEIYISNEIKKQLEDNYLNSNNAYNEKLNRIKKNLHEKGIIFFNLIKKTEKEIGIMVKTVENTFIYNYDFNSRKITLIGGARKNANIK